jgi:Rieske Fe-S protein
MDSNQTRREFCAQACQLAALALGGSLAGCGGGSGVTGPSGGGGGQSLPTVSASSAGGAATLAVDSASPLSAVGGAALVQTSGGLLLVAHTAQDTFSALNSTCTHERCTITGYTGQDFVCPCHGSRFDANGRVLTGPASRSLQSHPTQFASGVLTITL